MKYIIANWKANKNIAEVKQWIDKFKTFNFENLDVHIIICPPSPFILYLKENFITNSKISIGSQNLSIYESGTHTGEITAANLENIADYVIIGHSERRTQFNENDEILKNKFDMARRFHIKTLFCFGKINDWIPDNPRYIIYEPGFAISDGSGIGQNLTIEQILTIKRDLHFTDDNHFIYGGSVNEKDASLYLKNPQIDGVLVGGASLDPDRFYQIIASCN